MYYYIAIGHVILLYMHTCTLIIHYNSVHILSLYIESLRNKKHVEALKVEIQTNPTADVDPIACILSLQDGENFDPSMKEGHFYETSGGRNSREAYKQKYLHIAHTLCTQKWIENLL